MTDSKDSNPATPSPKPGVDPTTPTAPATPQPETLGDELLYGQCPMPLDQMPEPALREFVNHLQTGRRSAQTFKAGVQNKSATKVVKDETPKKPIEEQFKDFL